MVDVGANVGTAAISVGNGLTNVADKSSGGGTPQPGMRTYGWQGNTPINTATSAYVQFAIDTDSYSGVVLTLDAQRTNPGPTTSALYYSTDGVTWNFKANFSATTAWLGYGPFDFTGQTNASGVTYFRIYGNGANNTNSGSDITYDNVSFTGCAPALHPTITKAFAPASIPLAGRVDAEVHAGQPQRDAAHGGEVHRPAACRRAGPIASSRTDDMRRLADVGARSGRHDAGRDVTQESDPSSPIRNTCTVPLK